MKYLFQKGNKINLGRKPWNKGTKGKMKAWNKGLNKKTDKRLEKVGNRKSLTGKNAPNWKGGTAEASRKEWRKKNYNRVLYLNLRRKTMKRGAEGSHTFGEWEMLKAQYNWTCLCCKKREPEIKLTEDHIIPLIKGGSDNIENIQPLCKKCNSKKHTAIMNYKKP